MKKKNKFKTFIKMKNQLSTSQMKKIKGGAIGGNNLSGLGMEVGQQIIVEDIIME